MTSYTSVNRTGSSLEAEVAETSSWSAVEQPARSAALPGVGTGPSPSPLKSAFVYVAATLFCAFFGAVYELFSHEVYSYFMMYAFAIPLALGALPNLAITLKGWRAPGKLAANLWNAGVATLTVGCLFKGALDIYGTTNQLAVVYPVAAVLLLAAGIVLRVSEASPRAQRVAAVPQQAARPAAVVQPTASPDEAAQRATDFDEALQQRSLPGAAAQRRGRSAGARWLAPAPIAGRSEASGAL